MAIVTHYLHNMGAFGANCMEFTDP